MTSSPSSFDTVKQTSWFYRVQGSEWNCVKKNWHVEAWSCWRGKTHSFVFQSKEAVKQKKMALCNFWYLIFISILDKAVEWNQSISGLLMWKFPNQHLNLWVWEFAVSTIDVFYWQNTTTILKWKRQPVPNTTGRNLVNCVYILV